MARSPFPQGTALPDGTVLGRAVTAKNDTFWIHSTKDGRRALIVADAFAVSLFGKPSSTGDGVPFTFGAESYQVAVASSGGDNATMAKSFIIALEGPALTWYTRLPPLSIDS